MTTYPEANHASELTARLVKTATDRGIILDHSDVFAFKQAAFMAALNNKRIPSEAEQVEAIEAYLKELGGGD